MLTRITFLTIGQAPRSDLVPEIVANLPREVDVVETGALDGLDRAAIARLEPEADDHALVTRLGNGTQVVVGKRWVQNRLQEILCASRPSPQQATVLLCTGSFPGLSGTGLFLDAQHIVDHGVAAVCGSARRIGLLVPLARQQSEIHYEPGPEQELQTAYASPYEDADFEAAGETLTDCDVIVMHCMGYTEAQRSAVIRGAGRPVLLARRLVAASLAQLL